MSAPFHLEPAGPGNGDLAIVTAKGTLVALFYRGHGERGELVARRRAEAAIMALADQKNSCAWCEGVRDDGEICACTPSPIPLEQEGA